MLEQYSREHIHPSIFEAIDQLNSAAISGENPQASANMKAYNAYNSAWFSAHWKGFTAWMAGLVPTIATIPFLRNVLEVPKPASAALFFVGLSVWIGAGIYGWERTKKDVTIRELEAIIPALELTESQKQYLASVVAVLGSKILDSDQKQSWLKALYQALDNAVGLEKIHREMRQMIGGATHSELITEVESLRGRVGSAQDEQARLTYAESLRLAEGRLSRSEGMAAQSERIEAQLELTRQTFLQTHESLSGLTIGAQKSIHVSLDPLRANLSRVQNESESILRAIEELNQA
ncbi:MAG: hypothetical protein WCK51_05760 [Armatimonadota bacterium]